MFLRLFASVRCVTGRFHFGAAHGQTPGAITCGFMVRSRLRFVNKTNLHWTQKGRWWFWSFFWLSQHVRQTSSSHYATVLGWTIASLFSNSFCWWLKHHFGCENFLFSMLALPLNSEQSIFTNKHLITNKTTELPHIVGSCRFHRKLSHPKSSLEHIALKKDWNEREFDGKWLSLNKWFYCSFIW